MGQKYGLGVLCPVDEKGRFTSEAPGFEGLFYDDANRVVTKKLEEVGALLKLGFITHQYPHGRQARRSSGQQLVLFLHRHSRADTVRTIKELTTPSGGSVCI